MMLYRVLRILPWLAGIALSMLLIAISLVFLWYFPVRWSSTALLVTPGMSERPIVGEVARANQSYPVWLTTLLVRSLGWRAEVHYGEYALHDALSLSQLFVHMNDKSGLVQHRVTFIEGWTFSQMKQTLLHDDTLNHAVLKDSNAAIMQAIGSDCYHPEGQFYPDTYQYVWGNSALRILRQSHQLMQQVLQKAWTHRALGLSYQSPYEALIVASMIEVETPTVSERPLIAGVILERLKQGMRLQIDPTVLYGLGKPYGSTITKKDLATVTPYNTYRKAGLPPTPIDMPSQSSIQAALHPVFKGYLYYVSKGDGTHAFSKTYVAHQHGVARYRKIEAMSGSSQQVPVKPELSFSLDRRGFLIRLLQWFIFYE